jgi:hypothetical protein
MSNVLNEEKKQQVIGLGRLGWTLRRIEQETGVRRETAGGYLKAAGIAVRPSGGWGRRGAKPANEVTTESGESKPANEVITDYCGEIPISSDDEPQNRVPSASRVAAANRCGYWFSVPARGPGASCMRKRFADWVEVHASSFSIIFAKAF